MSGCTTSLSVTTAIRTFVLHNHREMLPFVLSYIMSMNSTALWYPGLQRIIIIIRRTGLFNYCPVRRRKVLHFSSSAAEESDEVWMLSAVCYMLPLLSQHSRHISLYFMFMQCSKSDTKTRQQTRRTSADCFSRSMVILLYLCSFDALHRPQTFHCQRSKV